MNNYKFNDYIGLIKKITISLSKKYGVEEEELFQESYFTFHTCSKNYTPGKVKFTTYLYHSIYFSLNSFCKKEFESRKANQKNRNHEEIIHSKLSYKNRIHFNSFTEEFFELLDVLTKMNEELFTRKKNPKYLIKKSSLFQKLNIKYHWPCKKIRKAFEQAEDYVNDKYICTLD